MILYSVESYAPACRQVRYLKQVVNGSQFFEFGFEPELCSKIRDASRSFELCREREKIAHSELLRCRGEWSRLGICDVVLEIGVMFLLVIIVRMSDLTEIDHRKQSEHKRLHESNEHAKAR